MTSFLKTNKIACSVHFADLVSFTCPTGKQLQTQWPQPSDHEPVTTDQRPPHCECTTAYTFSYMSMTHHLHKKPGPTDTDTGEVEVGCDL